MPAGAEEPTPLLRRLAARTTALRGWRRYGLALGLGLASALAFQPLGLVPALLPAFAGLVWLIDGSRTWRAAFAAGWWFGVGQFAAGLYWVSISFLVEPEKYAWMIPFVVFGMAAGLALFPAAATLAVALSRARGAGRVLALAVAWTAAEWLRGYVFTGFPWNLVGNIWTVSDATLQLAALTGVYGLSLLTVVIAALPATLGDAPAAGRGRPMRRWRPTAVAASLVIALWAGGEIRLAAAGAPDRSGVRLRVVQANIAQKLKWRRDRRAANFAEYIKLTRGAGFEAVDIVIWPETATPFFLEQNVARRRQAAAAAPAGGVLITGGLRAARDPVRFWNSILAILPTGEVAATYDKHHLVPFGEYMPLKGLIGLEKLTQGRTDFTAGPGPRTLTVAGLPSFSPLICYEIIFPGRVLDPDQRPRWLLNTTNDAWFGTSAGPYQHFASARMRAVEEGLPVVRAANTGISGVIDPFGRVTGRIGLNRKGILDARLPGPISPVTLYGRFGDSVVIFLLLIAVGGSVFLSRRS